MFRVGRAGHVGVSSEFWMSVAAKSFCEIRGTGTGGCSDLIAKSAILARARVFNQRVHLALQFIRKPSGIVILITPHTHGKWRGNRHTASRGIKHPASNTAPSTKHQAPAFRHAPSFSRSRQECRKSAGGSPLRGRGCRQPACQAPPLGRRARPVMRRDRWPRARRFPRRSRTSTDPRARRSGG